MEVDSRIKCLIEDIVEKLDGVVDSDCLNICESTLPKGKSPEYYEGFLSGITKLGKVYEGMLDYDEVRKGSFIILMHLIAGFSLLILRKEDI